MQERVWVFIAALCLCACAPETADACEHQSALCSPGLDVAGRCAELQEYCRHYSMGGLCDRGCILCVAGARSCGEAQACLADGICAQL